MDEKRLERIEEKIDRIIDHIGGIDSTLAAQHVSLQEHMKRSDLLEAAFKPVKAQVDMALGAIALLGLIGTIAVIIEAFRALK